MVTLLGSLLGFFASMFPRILDFFKDKSDKKQELALMDKEIQLQNARTENNIKEFEIRADSLHELAEIDALKESNIQAHKEFKTTGIKFVDGLRGSVRPIITYLMMSLYIFAKVTTLVYAYKNGATLETFAAIAFTEDDLAILATILSFWFGERVKHARK